MPKKILICLSPLLVAGCAGFPSTSPQQPPALVFVDGQILDSAEVVVQTRQRVAPPPTVTPVTTTPTAPGAAPPVTAPAPASATHLSRLQQTGRAGVVPVVGLPQARNLTVAQWVQKLLPAGWKRRKRR